MTGRVRVFASMPIWRAVAAEGDGTGLAGAQMDPVGADLHALFAFATLRLFDWCDRIDVNASGHTQLFSQHLMNHSILRRFPAPARGIGSGYAFSAVRPDRGLAGPLSNSFPFPHPTVAALSRRPAKDRILHSYNR